MLKALIFDVDGTLADTEETHRAAFNQAFAEHGLRWHWSQDMYAKLLATTGGKERIYRYARDHDPTFLNGVGIDERIAEIHRDKTVICSAAFRSGVVPLRPGIRRLMMEARQAGLKLAIATTTTRDNVECLIKGCFGIAVPDLFDSVSAGDCVAHKKPAPDVYQHALQSLGLPPNACLALEDSGNGLKAALAARIPTIVTTTRYTAGEDFTGALAIVPDVDEPDTPHREIRYPCPAVRFPTLKEIERLHRKVV